MQIAVWVILFVILVAVVAAIFYYRHNVGQRYDAVNTEDPEYGLSHEDKKYESKKYDSMGTTRAVRETKGKELPTKAKESPSKRESKKTEEQPTVKFKVKTPPQKPKGKIAPGTPINLVGAVRHPRAGKPPYDDDWVVDISVSCTNLVFMDASKKCDALVALFEQLDGKFFLIDQTELLKNNFNPEFRKIFHVHLHPQQKASYQLKVYDVDNVDVTEDDVIGYADIESEELLEQAVETADEAKHKLSIPLSTADLKKRLEIKRDPRVILTVNTIRNVPEAKNGDKLLTKTPLHLSDSSLDGKDTVETPTSPPTATTTIIPASKPYTPPDSISVQIQSPSSSTTTTSLPSPQPSVTQEEIPVEKQLSLEEVEAIGRRAAQPLPLLTENTEATTTTAPLSKNNSQKGGFKNRLPATSPTAPESSSSEFITPSKEIISEDTNLPTKIKTPTSKTRSPLVSPKDEKESTKPTLPRSASGKTKGKSPAPSPKDDDPSKPFPRSGSGTKIKAKSPITSPKDKDEEESFSKPSLPRSGSGKNRKKKGSGKQENETTTTTTTTTPSSTSDTITSSSPLTKQGSETKSVASETLTSPPPLPRPSSSTGPTLPRQGSSRQSPASAPNSAAATTRSIKRRGSASNKWVKKESSSGSSSAVTSGEPQETSILGAPVTSASTPSSPQPEPQSEAQSEPEPEPEAEAEAQPEPEPSSTQDNDSGDEGDEDEKDTLRDSVVLQQESVSPKTTTTTIKTKSKRKKRNRKGKRAGDKS